MSKIDFERVKMKKIQPVIYTALIYALVACFLSINSEARKASLSMKNIESDSDCIVHGVVQEINEVQIRNHSTLPEKLKIISIKINKKIKSSTLLCASITEQIDIVASGGPANGIRAEPCDLPTVGMVKNFYIDTKSYIPIPVGCYSWFQ